VLLGALERAGAAVAAATVARPSLDDVYLRYAGRRFAEAESAPDQIDTRDEPALATAGGTR
ncbi:MAG TPA: ABC transporter, partial [Streptomyces sp.]|nr:ABC transporter [Streptomyces sp.]